MTIGVFAGAFDLLHPGHLAAIEEASHHCDHLIIALQINPNLDRDEKARPIESTMERTLRLRALIAVDEIVPYGSEQSLRDLIVAVGADIVFAGAEHEGAVTGSDLASVTLIDRQHTWSTTRLRGRIKVRENTEPGSHRP